MNTVHTYIHTFIEHRTTVQTFVKCYFEYKIIKYYIQCMCVNIHYLLQHFFLVFFLVIVDFFYMCECTVGVDVCGTRLPRLPPDIIKTFAKNSTFLTIFFHPFRSGNISFNRKDISVRNQSSSSSTTSRRHPPLF